MIFEKLEIGCLFVFDDEPYSPVLQKVSPKKIKSMCDGNVWAPTDILRCKVIRINLSVDSARRILIEVKKAEMRKKFKKGSFDMPKDLVFRKRSNRLDKNLVLVKKTRTNRICSE